MAKVKKKSKVLAVSQPTTIIKKKNIVPVDNKVKSKKKVSLTVEKTQPVKLTEKDMKAFDTQNAKAAKILEEKRYDNEFRKKAGLPLHKGGKGLSKAEKEAREAAKAAVPKRGRGRPKKIRTPEEIAEMERIAAEKKARGRGRPRKHPLPTPEEIAAKEARKAERERRKKEKERLLKKKEMQQGKVLEKAAALKSGIKSFTAAGGRTNKPTKNSSKAKSKGAQALAKYEDVMTTFQQEFGDLKKMFGAEAEDFQNDKSSIAMLRSMVAMTMDMLPIAEAAYRKSPNNFNASALVNLSNQARELANDIRNLQSLEQQIEHIGTEIIMPGTRMMAEHLVSEIFKLKKEISFYIKKAGVRRILLGHIESLGYTHGKFMTRTTMEMREKVRKYMTE